MNRKLAEVEPYTKTIVQLFVAGIVLVPYVLATGAFGFDGMGVRELVLLAVVGIVHTSIAFGLWFDALGHLSATTVAILEYIDPIVALSISVLVFSETLTPLGWVGAAMVLGAMAASELLPSGE